MMTPIEKAKKYPKSMRYAINAKCFDCIYDKLEPGTWRQQVEACKDDTCALYTLRPTSAEAKGKPDFICRR